MAFETEIMNCMCRIFAMTYLEEKHPQTEQLKKMIKDITDSSFRSLEEYHKHMKLNPEAYNDSQAFKFLDSLFNDKQAEDVENARKLLESKGYRVVK